MDSGSYDEHQHYCEQVSAQESILLRELDRITHIKFIHPRMISGRYLGRVLSMLSRLIQPERILEIGTFTGYSALCLAEGLKPDGELITIDKDDELTSIQNEFIGKSAYDSQIKCLIGNALELLPDLKGPFDLIFLDADKENYSRYLPMIIDLSRVGTHILIDNMLWGGKVLDDKHNDAQTRSIKELTAQLSDDPRIEQILLPVRDGLMVIRVDSL